MTNWIKWKWTEEKPYPETLETPIHVLFDDGWDSMDWETLEKVHFWVYGINNFEPSLGPGNCITHYRLA